MLENEYSVDCFINEIEKHIGKNKLLLTGNFVNGYFQIIIDPLNYEVNEKELFLFQNTFELCMGWTGINIEMNKEESVIYYLYFNKKDKDNRNGWNWDIAIEFI